MTRVFLCYTDKWLITIDNLVEKATLLLLLQLRVQGHEILLPSETYFRLKYTTRVGQVQSKVGFYHFRYFFVEYRGGCCPLHPSM
jgi:hypothetical protein